MRKRLTHWLLAAMAIAATTTACETVDDERIPPYPVRIIFQTPGDWNAFGVSGAGIYRTFIKDLGMPAGYFYTASEETGFGGVLLVGNARGDIMAFDLACPVEVRRDVRIRMKDNFTAECPECHSVFNMAEYGGAISGPANKKGYGLRRYTVSDSDPGLYRLIRNR